MNREELIELICPSEYAAARECHECCSLCVKMLNDLLDEYDKTIKDEIRNDKEQENE